MLAKLINPIELKINANQNKTTIIELLFFIIFIK